jgi:pyruvate decarboxylase
MTIITQTLGRYFKPGDFAIAETGTSSYGIPASSLVNVDNVRMYNQTVFGSIGYATGAALGSFVAGKEDGSIKRGILVTGEGSLQLTVQTFSDFLRHGLNSTM